MSESNPARFRQQDDHTDSKAYAAVQEYADLGKPNEMEIIPGWTFGDNHSARKQGWYVSSLTFEIMNLRPFSTIPFQSSVEKVIQMASSGDALCQRALEAVTLYKLTR